MQALTLLSISLFWVSRLTCASTRSPVSIYSSLSLDGTHTLASISSTETKETGFIISMVILCLIVVILFILCIVVPLCQSDESQESNQASTLNKTLSTQTMFPKHNAKFQSSTVKGKYSGATTKTLNCTLNKSIKKGILNSSTKNKGFFYSGKGSGNRKGSIWTSKTKESGQKKQRTDIRLSGKRSINGSSKTILSKSKVKRKEK